MVLEFNEEAHKVINIAKTIPIIILIIELAFMTFCLLKLSKEDNPKCLSKRIWAFIIIFGSLIGQLAYLSLADLKD